MAIHNTYGKLRALFVAIHPDVKIEVIDSYIQGRIARVDAVMPWSTLEAQVSISLQAQRTSGTLNVARGLEGVNLTPGDLGQIFEPWMDGTSIIGVGGRTYRFAYVDATNGRLDRPYEGEDATAAPFWLRHWRVPAPPDFAAVTAVKGCDLESAAYLNEVDPFNMRAGEPSIVKWAGSFLEVWPLPMFATSLQVTYTRDRSVTAGAADAVQQSISRSDIIRDGVLADLAMLKGALGQAQGYEELFLKNLAEIQFNDVNRGGGTARSISGIDWPDRGASPRGWRG